MDNNQYNELCDLLELQRTVLRDGKIGDIPTVLRKIEKAMEKISVDVLSDRDVSALRSLSKRNMELILSARQGLGQAKRSIEVLTSKEVKFVTYSRP